MTNTCTISGTHVSLFDAMSNLGSKQQRLCSVNGCENKYYSINLCQKHYSRWKRHGDPNKILISFDHDKLCSVENCNNKYHAKNLCFNHYCRMIKHGDPLVDKRQDRIDNSIGGKYIEYQRNKRNTKKGRAQMRAQLTINNAKIRGEIRPLPCEICEEKKSQAHHDSYKREDWKNVRWLCLKHHREWHKFHSPIYQ